MPVFGKSHKKNTEWWIYTISLVRFSRYASSFKIFFHSLFRIRQFKVSL